MAHEEYKILLSANHWVPSGKPDYGYSPEAFLPRQISMLTGFYPSPKSFWSCTHVNSCQKYTLYISIHILLNTLSKATLNIQESRKFIKSLKRYQELIKKTKIHCVLLSHELLSTKNILHINSHIVGLIYFKAISKIQKLSKSNKYIKRYIQNNFYYFI